MVASHFVEIRRTIWSDDKVTPDEWNIDKESIENYPSEKLRECKLLL